MIYSGHGDVLGMVKGKIVAFARAFLGGSVASDVVVLALVALALGLVPFVRRVRAPAWAVLGAAALFAVALVAPRQVGAGYHLDSRLAALPVLIAAAATRFEWRRAAAGRAAYALLAVGAFARVGVLALDWSRAGSAMDDLDARLAALPAGGMLLTGTARPLDSVGWWEIWSPPAMHVATLAVSRGVFVPSMFALPSQQPLALKPRYRPWVGVQPVTSRADLDRLREAVGSLCDARPIGAGPTRVYALVQFVRPAPAAGPAWPPGAPLPHGFTLLDLCAAPG